VLPRSGIYGMKLAGDRATVIRCLDNSKSARNSERSAYFYWTLSTM
jgi:hypothetical protein